VPKQVLLIYDQLDKNVQADPTILTKLHSELSRMVSASYQQAMNSDEGYCFKFTLPTTAVMGLFNLLKLDQPAIGRAFQADWKFPNHAVMYNDPYYQILLLVIYYGIRRNDDQMLNNALFLLLQKIWNGRKYAYIKYCDKRVMAYLVNHMVNKKHNVARFDTPLALMKDYFVPTLMKKYRPEIAKDVYRLRQLFMQCWARVDQMFVFNPVVDIKTGEKRAQGGLLPMYMKAKAEGLYQSTPTIMKGDSEEDPNFDQYSTIHNRDSIVTSTVDYITMNSKSSYSQSVIDEINKNTKVSSKVIEQMLVALHNHKNYDLLHDALTVILSRTKVVDKNDICNKEFMNNVKRNIVSSKNTEEIRKLQKVLSIIASKVFTEALNLSLDNYGKAQQMQISNVVLYGLIVNLQKHNCQNLVDIT
jgi:hypothetical protein